MSTPVTLIPGDGISRELIDPICELLARAGARIAWERHEAGRAALASCGEVLPHATLDSVRRTGLALRGKLLASPDSPVPNPNSELRRRLGMFAAVRPIKTLPGLAARHQDVDLVLIRECTEDIYAELEHQMRPGIVSSLKVVTAAACERIARYAFDFARLNGRRKVSLIHKANIMKITDGLFIETTDRVAAEYSDIDYDKLIVDNACMQLVMRPHRYDVILCGNLYGDIMADLGDGIVGGISASAGMASSGEAKIFETVHGDAAHLVGSGMANPLPLLRPACYLLINIGQADVAARLEAAIGRVLARGIKTPDLGGDATSAALLEAIGAEL